MGRGRAQPEGHHGTGRITAPRGITARRGKSPHRARLSTGQYSQHRAESQHRLSTGHGSPLGCPRRSPGLRPAAPRDTRAGQGPPGRRHRGEAPAVLTARPAEDGTPGPGPNEAVGAPGPARGAEAAGDGEGRGAERGGPGPARGVTCTGCNDGTADTEAEVRPWPLRIDRHLRQSQSAAAPRRCQKDESAPRSPAGRRGEC